MREFTQKTVPSPALPRAVTNKVTTNGLIKGDQSGEYVPVLALDCRY